MTTKTRSNKIVLSREVIKYDCYRHHFGSCLPFQVSEP